MTFTTKVQLNYVNKLTVYTAFFITVADNPVLSSQVCQKSLIISFPKLTFKNQLLTSQFFQYNACVIERKLFNMSPQCSGQKCKSQELLLLQSPKEKTASAQLPARSDIYAHWQIGLMRAHCATKLWCTDV